MTLNELKKKALDDNIPIMEDDSIEYIARRTKLFELNKILEIGSAVGYSAIALATYNDKVHITTIEKDSARFLVATKNIKEFNLNNRIELIFNDALEVNVVDKYNLIIIDAAKGKNEEFFNKFKENLLPGGFIIIDNIKFHGLVGKSDEIESKDLRSLVKKIENFIEFLSTEEVINEFYVEILDIGDGLAICQKKD